MHRKMAIGLTLAAVFPVCGAAVLCGQLSPTSQQYRAQIGLVAQEAGLKDRFTQYDEQVVANFCGNRPDEVDELIDQGRVSAREASAIRKVLVLTKSGGAGGVAASPSINKVSQPRRPTDKEAHDLANAVDDLFIRWSQNWFTDRYTRGSADINEVLDSANNLIVRGKFSFSRGGRLAIIPFAATATGKDKDYSVTNLCYNDTTTGMTDCTASGASSAASRIMGQVIINGLLAGMSNSSSSSNGGRDESGCQWVEYCQSTNQYNQCVSYNHRQECK